MKIDETIQLTPSQIRHNLKNHISVIQLFTELISKHVSIDDEKLQSYIQTIQKRTKELTKDVETLIK